jgi:hypothetical protein
MRLGTVGVAALGVGCAASYAAAAASSTGSQNGAAMICSPIGSPEEENPIGTDITGHDVRVKDHERTIQSI